MTGNHPPVVPPPKARLEFARCCGTICDKVVGLRQVEKLARIWKLLREPLKRFNPERVCYIKGTRGRKKDQILGVFIPIKDVEELFDDKKGPPK